MPPLVLIVAMLFTPLILIFASNLLNATRQLYEAPPGWINIARLINGVLAPLCIIYAFILERIILKSPEKIKKGGDTEFIALLCGVALCEAPAVLAFCFFMVGSPVVDVEIYSALSFAAIIAWAWRYRQLLIPTPVDAEHKPIIDNTLLIPKSSSVNTNTLVRPYTVVLGILGLLSFLFLASEIMLVIHPPEDYYLGQKEMTIFLIPFYLLFSLSCWITTILRTKKFPLASFATRATSYILIAWFPFGTAAFFYWIGKVRKKENMG
ncbi:MAG: hypothetical protein LWX51_04835 [Deltaproteobacteria bacterium]|jgi:MFS family permease|nr:hypothetical protein [Deltaproteobacteria bacterium]